MSDFVVDYKLFSEMEKECSRLRSELSRLKNKYRWVPVSEKLPAPDKEIEILWRYDDDVPGMYRLSSIAPTKRKRTLRAPRNSGLAIFFWRYLAFPGKEQEEE